MRKQKLTLSVDDELITMAKEENINISAFLEDCLAKKLNLEPMKSCWKVKEGWGT